MTLQDEVKSQFIDLLREVEPYLPQDNGKDIEAVGAPVDYVTDLATRLSNIANVYYAVPEGMVEFRASLDKFTAADGKAVVVQLDTMNCIKNIVALSQLIGTTVTVRGLQGDIEALAETPPPEIEAGDHPDQTTFDDLEHLDNTSEPDIDAIHSAAVADVQTESTAEPDEGSPGNVSRFGKAKSGQA